MAMCDFAALNSSRAERCAIARQLVTFFRADNAGFFCLGETGFERRLAADLLQVVVAPADRVGADANAHA
jgi:hypothetical protein